MAVRVAINGFGRIGRLVYRAGYKDKDIDFVIVNDLTDVKTLAHLLKYDSTYRMFPDKIEIDGNDMIVAGKRLKVLTEKDPAKLPWKDMGIDIVVESTGVFTTREKMEYHLAAGAKKVLLTAPAKSDSDVDITVVIGVNDDKLTSSCRLVSNASCTTNCLAPLVKILHENFGVEEGLMTTIHSYTNDQRILDLFHKDLRRARSAAMNIIPTTTGAAKAIGLVIPELKGKLNGIAIRVPTPDGSLVDLVCTLKKEASVEEINRAVKNAAEKNMKGIVQYTEDPIVSSDIIGNTHSCIFDALSTMKIGTRMVKVFAWYDNELGYSTRCVELIKKMASAK